MGRTIRRKGPILKEEQHQEGLKRTRVIVKYQWHEGQKRKRINLEKGVALGGLKRNRIILKDATILGKLEKECDHLERCSNIRNQKKNYHLERLVTKRLKHKG
jgi:hypothetical protein